MPLLNKQQILAVQDKKFQDVDVPEWGGTVRLATLTASQRDRYETMFTLARNDPNSAISIRALLVAACVVDDEGNPIFTQEDVAELSEKSASALTKLFTVALDLNVLTKAAAEKVAGS